MSLVGWAPIGHSGQTVRLETPYVAHDSHLIQPSQDFTVRFTTISKSILDVYGSEMKRGKLGNDYFCLLSQFGIGSGGENKASNSINHVVRHDQVRTDTLSFWGENIRFIKDYRDLGTNGNAGRVFIGTSSFCQSLGKSPVDRIHEAYDQVSKIIGRFAPWLTPYTTVASSAVEGVANILKKIVDHKSECFESSISLFPGSLAAPLPPGDAYLQRGSYVFFFDQKFPNTDIGELFLDVSGRVVKRSGSDSIIPPYVVINIVDGIQDAPSEVFSKAVAVDILEKYQARYGIDPKTNFPAMTLLLEGLQKIGDSYYYISRIERFKELLVKGSKRLDKETARMNEIKEEIETKFPQLKLPV